MATFYCPDCGGLRDDGSGNVGAPPPVLQPTVAGAGGPGRNVGPAWTNWNASIGGSPETYIRVYVHRVSQDLTHSVYAILPWAEEAIRRRWPLPISVVQEWNALHPKSPVWTQYPDGSPYVPGYSQSSNYPGAPWAEGFWPWVAQQFSHMMISRT